jgi:AraC-like DNA-binding protein
VPTRCSCTPELPLSARECRGPGIKDGPTALGTWGLAIVAALRSSGVNPEPLLAQAGLSLSALADPSRRHSLDVTTRLWRLAVDATGDPAFGIAVARHTNYGTFHALGFSLATSGTLREALERIQRFFALVTDAADVRLRDEASGVRLTVHLRDSADPADEAVDAFVAATLRLCRALSGREFVPLAVELRRPAPKDLTPFNRYFRVPVTFGAPLDALMLDRASTEARLLTANAEIARANDAVAADHVARLESSRIALRVRHAIADGLPHGEPDAGVIARRLGVSLRTLQRKLAEEGTTFASLVDDTRRALGRGYVEDGRHSVSEIAYLLGFSGVSSFSHAFKRWTGLSPSAYRETRGERAGARGFP